MSGGPSPGCRVAQGRKVFELQSPWLTLASGHTGGHSGDRGGVVHGGDSRGAELPTSRHCFLSNRRVIHLCGIPYTRPGQ